MDQRALIRAFVLHPADADFAANGAYGGEWGVTGERLFRVQNFYPINAISGVLRPKTRVTNCVRHGG